MRGVLIPLALVAAMPVAAQDVGAATLREVADRFDAAQIAQDARLLDALTGKGSSEATRASFRQRFTEGSLATAEVEIDVDEAPAMPFDIPGMGAQVFDLKSMMGKLGGQQPRARRKLKVPDAFARLTDEEADKRLDPDDVNRAAKYLLWRFNQVNRAHLNLYPQ